VGRRLRRARETSVLLNLPRIRLQSLHDALQALHDGCDPGVLQQGGGGDGAAGAAKALGGALGGALGYGMAAAFGGGAGRELQRAAERELERERERERERQREREREQDPSYLQMRDMLESVGVFNLPPPLALALCKQRTDIKICGGADDLR
jgi:hypothetical protein